MPHLHFWVMRAVVLADASFFIDKMAYFAYFLSCSVSFFRVYLYFCSL